MITAKFLRIKMSDIVNYNPIKLYKKGEICTFGNKLYRSNSNDNMNDSPILGLKWDQVL